MLFEIQGIDILLRRWNENPGAPISVISPFSADRDRSRPYTREEIARRVAFMRKHAPTAMALLTAECKHLRDLSLDTKLASHLAASDPISSTS